MRSLIVVVGFLIAFQAISAPDKLFSIPVRCEDTDKLVESIKTPEGFSVSPKEALEIAMNNSNIKWCGSKLEQVVYYDSENYYFFNSVELLSDEDIRKIGFSVEGVKHPE